MWEEIIQQLKTIMEANTNIQETYIFESEKFNGSPACTITPSENESDFESSRDNERIYAFNVRLYVNRSVQSGGQVEPEADRIMRNLVDSVLDDLDKNITWQI